MVDDVFVPTGTRYCQLAVTRRGQTETSVNIPSMSIVGTVSVPSTINCVAPARSVLHTRSSAVRPKAPGHFLRSRVRTGSFRSGRRSSTVKASEGETSATSSIELPAVRAHYQPQISRQSCLITRQSESSNCRVRKHLPLFSSSRAAFSLFK